MLVWRWLPPSTHTCIRIRADHSLNKLIYLFQLFDKCIIPQTLRNHFRGIISFMMWKDCPEYTEESLYWETMQELSHLQSLGWQGEMCRREIFSGVFLKILIVFHWKNGCFPTNSPKILPPTPNRFPLTDSLLFFIKTNERNSKII